MNQENAEGMIEATMESDRNKSGLTHEVTGAAAAWLDAAGFKPVETEVPITAGWVADLAGVLEMTRTEAVNLKIIPRRPKWSKPEAMRREWESAFMSLPSPATGLVEVKVSRSDFRGDHKWLSDPQANLMWLAIPAGLLTEAEYPAGWGILHFKNNAVRCVRPAPLHRVDVERRMSVLLNIAIRRDHHTRYERLRGLRRAIRDRQNDAVSRTRITYAVRAVIKVAKGEAENIEAAMKWYGIKKIPQNVMADLQTLWGIMRKEPTARCDGVLESQPFDGQK